MLTWQWVAGSVVLLKSVVATMQCCHLCISGLFVWRSIIYLCLDLHLYQCNAVWVAGHYEGGGGVVWANDDGAAHCHGAMVKIRPRMVMVSIYLVRFPNCQKQVGWGT